MLSADHIRTYLAFGGDADAWARSDHGLQMTDRHWALIEELRQGLYLCASGLASGELVARTERRLLEVTADEETRDLLRAMVTGAPDRSPPARTP